MEWALISFGSTFLGANGLYGRDCGQGGAGMRDTYEYMKCNGKTGFWSNDWDTYEDPDWRGYAYPRRKHVSPKRVNELWVSRYGMEIALDRRAPG